MNKKIKEMAQVLSKVKVKVSGSTPPAVYTALSICLLLLLSLLTFFSFSFHKASPPPPSSIFLSSADNSSLSSLLRRLSLRPHLAGTPSAAAVTSLLTSRLLSLSPHLLTHSLPLRALLSYPSRSSLSALLPDASRLSFLLSDTPDSAVVIPYHAYSPSGAASAQAVFVNFGSDDDYLALAAVNVTVAGCVVVARKGGSLSRADVVERAEARGAKAVLIFSGAGGDGQERFRDGFERGTVMRGGVGDPLTPGWAGGERLSPADPEVSRRFPKIPSMPLSFHVAEAILRTLGGHPLPRAWRDSLGSTMVVQRVGPGPTILDFEYQGENRVETIQNVFAVIKGSEEPDRYVLLGNHRDAWTYGAVDPSSGTATMLDIARRFALMLQSGWTPRRTIILCSWDAEEFGMIGSTEWVEQNLVNLGSKAVAYLNVDCAVQGPGFFVSATPQLDNLILEILKKVNDPDLVGATLYQNWTRNKENSIERLGRVDSDFSAFLHHAGIPAVDLYYGRDFPVYHTAFDSYDWMKNYGDPFFHRHVAVAGVWGLLALHLADDPIIPFDYRSYANQLKGYEEILRKLLDGIVSLSPLTTSIQEFASAAQEAAIEAQKLREEKATSEAFILKRRTLNDRLMLAERGFLDSDGIEGRRWFKHLIYGPPSDPESKIDFFPGIADAISKSATMSSKQKKSLIQHEIWRVARAIQRAASALRGELT